MTNSRYEKLQALVVDDFDSFRATLIGMLQDLGVANVDSSATSAEALRFCASKAYDIILCDQNLGKGKTGQQMLEVLRSTPNNNSDSLFVLVSAESNKSIIMAAYDFEPDGYLTKPITAQALAQRLNRLLTQRLALAPIYKAIKHSNIDDAISLCLAEINSSSRYNNLCQKILGRLLLDAGRVAEAETLYRDILELRQLDWAMLGMAQVKKLQGDWLSAQQWLEDTIQSNPLCLKAYDALAQILRERDDNSALQKVIQQAVDLSPLSILRQQALGEVALKNNDVVNSVGAYRKAVKLGENSCHDNVGIHINFTHSAIQLAQMDKNLAKPFLRDALKTATELPNRFGKTLDTKTQSHLLEAQLHLAADDDRKSKEALLAAQKVIEPEWGSLSLDTKIEFVKALHTLGNQTERERITALLLKEYIADQEALQKIDCLLDEPTSDKNRALVAKINKEGIAFYDSAKYSKAVESFSGALRELPQHIGLRLNLAQALLGLLKQHPDDEALFVRAQQTLHYISQIISASHVQYRRLRQLEELLRTCEPKEASH